MTTRKRNDFLDIVSSDDEDNDRGYDSEAAEESKGRSLKRRKTKSRSDGLGSDSSEEDSDVSEIEESDLEAEESRLSKPKQGQGKSHNGPREESHDVNESDENDDDEGEEGEKNDYGGQFLDVAAETDAKGKTKGQKSLDKLKVKPTKKNKTGVVYFSSLPPYLKPFALQSLLETRGFAPITKVFLAPTVRAPSGQRRSNKRKTYSDGWVEFASKKTAKICAETLNATIVGGRKGGWYHDDVWNLKYLTGYKWADLHEQIQRERSEKEAKRRIEDARARKEEKVFLQGYEKGKMLEGIQKKNEEKRKRKMQQTGDGEGKQAAVNARRLFKQNEVKLGRDKVLDQGSVEDDTRRVLGKIF
ncbi:hypothetical protein BDW59DRAFT_142232 [Aspergillus cavernicola]|uniref:Pre-rRNA-processing protein ESF2 n=1 Tax=Aspergillus cavernicola TaxID=176166 RepID=A0ABR4IN49_9EURO